MFRRSFANKMVAIFLTCAFVFLACLDAAAPPPAAAPPVVPAAVAAAVVILDIAADIKKLFDTSNEDILKNQKEILKKLDEIQAKLNEMDQKLNTIIARFDELEFHIDRKFEEQRAIDVMTAIGQIDQHFPTWIDKNYKPGVDPTVPDPKELLIKLRETSTALRKVPSFANFSTVALAMAYERLLLVQVLHAKPNNPDMQRGFAQYATFFEDAASAKTNPSAVSVGLRWANANLEFTNYMSWYAKLAKPLRNDTGVAICCENPQDWWYVGTLVTRYDGDPLKGFTPVAEESNLKYGPGGTARLLCYNSDHPAYPRRSGCPANVGNVGALNPTPDNIHATAVAKKQVVDDLDAALNSLRDFHEQADLWAGVPREQIAVNFPDPRKRKQLDFDLDELQKLIASLPSLNPLNFDTLLNTNPQAKLSDLPELLKQMSQPKTEPDSEAPKQ
jgi:hypothetical protein